MSRQRPSPKQQPRITSAVFAPQAARSIRTRLAPALSGRHNANDGLARVPNSRFTNTTDSPKRHTSVQARPSGLQSRESSMDKDSILFIWFDERNDDPEETERFVQMLREINDFVIHHSSIDECTSFLNALDKDRKVFLIISGTSARRHLATLDASCHVDSIFIYCMNPEKYEQMRKDYDRVLGVFNQQDELVKWITANIHLTQKQQQVFSFYDQHQKATRDLTREAAEFMWFQLFKHVVFKMPSDSRAKQQMLEHCREYYRGNTLEMKLIKEFDRNYRREEAIRWYTKQSFLYQLVNKALRTEDVEQLHTFRFYIADLSASLADEHRQMSRWAKMKQRFFRGAKMAHQEVEILRANEGKLIATNGFLSTSRSEDVANDFLQQPSRREGIVNVLFVIDCNMSELDNNIIFADIAKFSDFPDEQEVLFDLDAVFNIDRVEWSEEENRWIVTMSASSAGLSIANKYIELNRRELEETSLAVMFGSLLAQMGKYDKAQQFFERLIEDPQNEDMARLHNSLGGVHGLKGDYQEEIRMYNLAYDELMSAQPPRVKDSARVLCNLGNAYFDLGEDDQALRYYEETLAINEKFKGMEHADTAATLMGIGLVWGEKGDDDQALKYHTRALKIQQTCLPADHVDIAASLTNIGLIHWKKNDLSIALDYLQRALKMQEVCLPADHVSLGISLMNIGKVLRSQGQTSQALDHQLKALDILLKAYPNGHPDIARNLHMIARGYADQEEWEQTVNYFQQALDMYEKTLPPDHPDTVMCQQHLSNVKRKLR